MRYFITIKEWESNYPNPMKLEQNEIVRIKKRENDNPNCKGWIFCETLNSFGWVPEQIINRIEKNKGLIKEKYSAKEMNINEGEIILELKELNGWKWAKKKIDNSEGWLPNEILKEITKKEYDLWVK
ncbi:MAG: hypothetical protein GY936_04475 [Ignavibacteriae bacterium]|nr:hypothetical protein [Ignavibacteriota bacterium]